MRGLSIRILTSLNSHSILYLQLLALNRLSIDSQAYVRREAAIGLLKVYTYNQNYYRDQMEKEGNLNGNSKSDDENEKDSENEFDLYITEFNDILAVMLKDPNVFVLLPFYGSILM